MTVPPVPDLLAWLHLAIALIGSFNCLLLAFVLLYFYRDPFHSERYLASWLALLALYFGLMPNLLSPMMMLPTYALQYFALPCLYLYLSAQLRQRKARAGRHLLLPTTVFLYTLLTAWLHADHRLWAHLEADGFLLVLLPLGAVAQYLYYARATWRLWQRWSPHDNAAPPRPGAPNYAWLLTLTITSGLVWLLRLIGTSLPLWTHRPLAPWMVVSKRITVIGLLLFGLFYGLRQLTTSAWQQRRRSSSGRDAGGAPTDAVLDAEERAFLRDLNKKH